MAIQKSEAIVLKTYNFRETSLIVHFFTKDFGKISGLIKGIWNDLQRYGGLPLIFSHSFVVFYERQKDLNLVTQCDAKEQFLPIRADLQKTNYASYFIELLDAVTQSYDKNEQLFTLALNSLKALCVNYKSRQIARVLEIKLLNLSGFRPRLDACVNCQREIFPYTTLNKDPCAKEQRKFSSILGGLLCPRCFNSDRNAKAILKGTLASIEYIEKTDWQKSLQLKMATSVANELMTILNSFLDIHLQKRIKSRKFLN